MFLRAFGGVLRLDGLLVSFGLANVLSALPITPGGLGIVEGIYIPDPGRLRAEPAASAALGVPSYRLAQYWLPHPARRPRLPQPAGRAVVHHPGASASSGSRVAGRGRDRDPESQLDWAERYGHRPTDPTVPVDREPAGAPAPPTGEAAPPAA